MEPDTLSRFHQAIRIETDDPEPLQELLHDFPDLDINTIHCSNGFEDLLESRIELEPDLTLLHVATIQGHTKVVDLLLKRKARQIPTKKLQLTPLHLAAAFIARPDTSMRLLQGIPESLRKDYVNKTDFYGLTSLHHATRNASTETFHLLLDYGADLCVITKSGQTCLHIAAEAKNCTIFSYLMGKLPQPYVTKSDANGNTVWDYVSGHCVPKMTSVWVPGFKVLLQNEVAARQRSNVQRDEYERLQALRLRNINLKICNRLELLVMAMQLSHPIHCLDLWLRSLLESHDYRDPNDENTILIRYIEPSCVIGGAQSGSLLIPFFHLQTPKDLEPWRDAETKSEQFTMLARKWRWEYCVSDRSKSYGICLPLTLDEYCCSILPPEMLRTRNYDQVLTRTKKSESKPEKLIVVSQLWVLWTRNKFVFSPENLPDSMGYLESYQRDLPAMFFVAKMIVRLLDYLDQPPSNAVLPNPIPSKSCKSAPIEEESILGSFQKAILFASEDVNRYYKDVSIKHIESDREKNYVHQMNDIREELSMIKRVLLQQERVWKDFAQAAWPEKDSWPDGPEGPLVIFKGQRQHSSLSFRDYEKDWDEIERIPARFSKYHRRINELNEDSARVEQAISAKLELMAKHATIRESHATAVMSAAVFGFSLVTIIFTPLSFFAALFALPIDRFQAAQDPGKFSSETGMYSTKYIGKWIATGEVVSIFVTLFAMWLVVKFGVDVHVFGPLWQMLRNLAGGISSLLTEKFLSGNEVKAEAVSTQSETRSGQTRTQKDGLLPGNTEQTEPVSSRSSKIGNGGNVDLERQ